MRRRTRKEPLTFDRLLAALESGRVNPDELPLTLTRHGADLDGATRFAEMLAQASVIREQDLSDRRKQRMFAAARGVALCAIAATLEAEAAR